MYAWPQEPITCHFSGIIIYIGVYGSFPHIQHESYWLLDVPTSNVFTTGLMVLVALVTGVISRDDVTEKGWFYWTRSHLTEISTDIPDKVTRVYLSYNDITTLHSKVFSRLLRCEAISLYDNDVSEIQVGAFAGTPKWYLDPHWNKLTEIRADMWARVDSFEILKLYQNRITRIESAAFRGLTELELLDLYDNGISGGS